MCDNICVILEPTLAPFQEFPTWCGVSATGAMLYIGLYPGHHHALLPWLSYSPLCYHLGCPLVYLFLTFLVYPYSSFFYVRGPQSTALGLHAVLASPLVGPSITWYNFAMTCEFERCEKCSIL